MLPLWYKIKTQGYDFIVRRDRASLAHEARGLFREAVRDVDELADGFIAVNPGIVDYYEKRAAAGPFEYGCCKPIFDLMWCEHLSPDGCMQIGSISYHYEDESLFLEFVSHGQLHNGTPCATSIVRVGFNGDRCATSWRPASYCNGAITVTGLATGVALCAMEFAHCKNVSVVECENGRVCEKWHRRTRCPKVQFKTIKIPLAARGKTATGEPRDGASPVPLHLVRGHFATYTADKPLFGRPDGVGRFFHPPHIRGDGSAGVVAKDYTIGN